MTCITGMVRNGHVYMAGDLMGSNGFTGRVYPDSKVFVNGDFIIGYTSSFRMGQILEWNWETPLRQEGISDREYMQLNVVESLRSTFAAYGYGAREGLEDMGGTFLIGYRGCLYEMQDNFSLLSIPDFAAVGSGSYHAEAILHLLYPDTATHPFSIMQAAIGTAAHFTQSVSVECTMFSDDVNADKDWTKEIESLEAELEVEGVAEEKAKTGVNKHFKQGIYEIMVYQNGGLYTYDDEPLFYSFVDEQEQFDIFDLKGYADLLGVKYSHNIGKNTLAQKLDDKVQEVVDELNQ